MATKFKKQVQEFIRSFGETEADWGDFDEERQSQVFLKKIFPWFDYHIEIQFHDDGVMIAGYLCDRGASTNYAIKTFGGWHGDGALIVSWDDFDTNPGYCGTKMYFALRSRLNDYVDALNATAKGF